MTPLLLAKGGFLGVASGQLGKEARWPRANKILDQHLGNLYDFPELMKRDMDIIRAILINAENDKYPYGARVRLDGVAEEVCAYHVALMQDAGLVDGHVVKSMDCPYAAASIDRLTSAGHDFLESSRSDTVWAKFKHSVVTVGGSVSIPVASELLKSIVKLQLGL